MADGKNKNDNRDRSRVAGDQNYEISYFAEKTGITVEQAVALIEQFENDRETLEREARKLA